MINIFSTTQDWLKQKNINFSAFTEINSTSIYARENITTNNSWVCYLADQQNSGKGRGKNTWSSPAPGTALMTTWSIRLPHHPQPQCTPRLGLGLFRAVKKNWPNLSWSLKAPNDLYLHDKKIAGLLVEVLSQGQNCQLLIGLGFNVLGSPSENSFTSTHLQAHLHTPLNSSEWALFLENWHYELQEIIQHNSQSPLSLEVRTELLTALKLNLAHKNLLEVSTQGDLIYPDKIIPWINL